MVVGERAFDDLCFDFPLFSVEETKPDELMLPVKRLPRFGPKPEPEFRRDVPENLKKIKFFKPMNIVVFQHLYVCPLVGEFQLPLD